MTGLESTTPREAHDWYLEEREEELAVATKKAHQYRLAPFLEWCELEEIDNLNDLTGRDFSKYKIWRKNSKGSPNNVTLNTQLSTIRVFIKWCGKRNIVPRDLFEYIDPPRMAPLEDVRVVTLSPENAAEILSHAQKFEYATRDHVLIELLWSVGMREGAIRALDLDDFVPDPNEDEEVVGPYLKIRHRPETETPLKNGELGERDVSLKPRIGDLLTDYIQTKRWERTDDYGSEPLVSTWFGRISMSAVRNTIYGLTRPCIYSDSCPENEEQSECDYASNRSIASGCPATVSPHAVRKGAITWSLLNDVPMEAISERMNVSPDVLKKHYDRRTKAQKMESRRAYFDNI